MKIHSTIICERCGLEYPSGIVSWATHATQCPGGAPNSSIDHHRFMVDLEGREKKAAEEARKEELAFKPILDQMSPEEQTQLVIESFPLGTDLPMGTKTFLAATAKKAAYKQKMINKYSH
jgi:hypothetical protein